VPPNRFESEVESFLEGSHGDRTHIKRADHPRLHHYAGRYSNVVNPTAFSLKIVVFGRRLTTFVTGVLARGFKLLRFDDVCNVVRPPALRPVPPAPSYQKVARVLDRKLCSG